MVFYFIHSLCCLDIKDIVYNIICTICNMVVYVYSRWLCNLEINDILKNVEIVVSICAFVCAFMAYRQSLKARRYSSFETIFSQMLSLQRSFFDNQYMLNANGRPLTDEFVSMFVYLKDLKDLDSLKDSTISICGKILKIAKLDSEIAKLDSEIKEQESKGLIQSQGTFILNSEKSSLEKRKKRLNNEKLNLENEKKEYVNKGQQNKIISTEILSLFYRDFTSQVLNVENFKNCFKFIYNIVMLVEKSKIDVEDKQLYIDRIQALLNRNEMFCYFVNLVEYIDKLSVEEKIKKHVEYIEILEKYNFFKDLDDIDGRFNELLKKIISEKENIYYILKKTSVNKTN